MPRALGLPTAYRWDDPQLECKYGPYGRAPTYLKNATGDYSWGAQAQGLYEATLPLVTPLARFEAWAAGVHKDYPTLTGWGGKLIFLILGAVLGVLGAVITQLVTCKPRS